MATVEERYQSRAEAFDLEQGQARRIYRIVLDNPDDPPRNVPGLPSIGDPHPWNANLRADFCRIDVVPGSSGVDLDATIDYSNNRRFRLPEQVDETSPTFRRWSASSAIFDIDVPRFVLNLIRITTRDSYDARITFEQDNRALGVPGQTLDRQLNLPTYSSTDETTIIAQVGKFHIINGRLYRFLGHDVDQRDENRWEIVYHWQSENGSLGAAPDPDDPNANLFVVGNANENFAGSNVERGDIRVVLPPPRPPFHDYQISNEVLPIEVNDPQPTSFEATFPRIDVIPRYTEEDIISPDGLPGDPFN